MVGITHNQNVVSPNSLTEEQKKQLKAAISEIDDGLTRILNEREAIKTIITGLSDAISLDKKIIRKLAKTYHNASFKSESEESDIFETFYTVLYPDAK